MLTPVTCGDCVCGVDGTASWETKALSVCRVEASALWESAALSVCVAETVALSEGGALDDGRSVCEPRVEISDVGLAASGVVDRVKVSMGDVDAAAVTAAENDAADDTDKAADVDAVCENVFKPENAGDDERNAVAVDDENNDAVA